MALDTASITNIYLTSEHLLKQLSPPAEFDSRPSCLSSTVMLAILARLCLKKLVIGLDNGELLGKFGWQQWSISLPGMDRVTNTVELFHGLFQGSVFRHESATGNSTTVGEKRRNFSEAHDGVTSQLCLPFCDYTRSVYWGQWNWIASILSWDSGIVVIVPGLILLHPSIIPSWSMARSRSCRRDQICFFETVDNVYVDKTLSSRERWFAYLRFLLLIL